MALSSLGVRSPDQFITRIRGQVVILDSDLAALYGVTVKRLNQQVMRNQDRFPEDFCFQVAEKEWHSLRLQNATLKRGQHRKYMPYAFTEHGAIMAATVLNSSQAVQMSVAVVRAFVKLRRMALSVEALARKVSALENKYDDSFRVVRPGINEGGEETGRLSFFCSSRRVGGTPVTIGKIQGQSLYWHLTNQNQANIEQSTLNIQR